MIAAGQIAIDLISADWGGSSHQPLSTYQGGEVLRQMQRERALKLLTVAEGRRVLGEAAFFGKAAENSLSGWGLVQPRLRSS
jgi:hypothetical protein